MFYDILLAWNNLIGAMYAEIFPLFVTKLMEERERRESRLAYERSNNLFDVVAGLEVSSFSPRRASDAWRLNPFAQLPRLPQLTPFSHVHELPTIYVGIPAAWSEEICTIKVDLSSCHGEKRQSHHVLNERDLATRVPVYLYEEKAEIWLELLFNFSKHTNTWRPHNHVTSINFFTFDLEFPSCQFLQEPHEITFYGFARKKKQPWLRRISEKIFYSVIHFYSFTL